MAGPGEERLAVLVAPRGGGGAVVDAARDRGNRQRGVDLQGAQ